MATERDDDVSRRYRELAREEPGGHLDAAILAASRRAVGSRPGGVRRWAGPVSIAAVLVLGIGVSLRMQMEQPGVETAMPQSIPAAEPPQVQPALPEEKSEGVITPPAASEAAASPAPAPRPLQKGAPAKPRKSEPFRAEESERRAAPPAQVPSPQPQALPDAKRMDAPAARGFAADAVAPAAPPAAAASASAPAAAASAPAPAAAPAPALRAKREAANVVETPEAELERIARLRSEGRHEEADRALEEFRRRHPEYRIPEATWERVRPRP